MEIKTNFQVGDLVHYKYYVPTQNQQKKAEIVIAYEVIEIKSVTCMGGTQTFYQLRPIHAVRAFGDEYAFLPGHMNSGNEYRTFREDELKAVSEATKENVNSVMTQFYCNYCHGDGCQECGHTGYEGGDYKTFPDEDLLPHGFWDSLLWLWAKLVV